MNNYDKLFDPKTGFGVPQAREAPDGSSAHPPSETQDGQGAFAVADGSAFWTDALNPANGAKIIAVYPSGSTVNFTATARKTTEGRNRAMDEISRLKGCLNMALLELITSDSNPGTRAEVAAHIAKTLSQNTKMTHTGHPQPTTE